MATKNEINSNIPIEVEKGGTEAASFIAYTPICGGTTTTDAVQSVASIANANDILTSEGAGALPVFKTPITYFEQLASDKSPSQSTESDVWYNTTSDLFKGVVCGVSLAWVVKANSLYAAGFNGGAGTPDDAFGCQNSTFAERYDGGADSWASKTSYGGTVSGVMVTGTSADDALEAGGTTAAPAGLSNQLKRYDGVGDSWTSKANMGTACEHPGFYGSGDDALKFGGKITLGPVTYTTAVERYDGVGNSWTSKASLNGVARNYICASGTAGDCLASGGLSSGGVAVSTVELYDGAGDSWTTKTSMGSTRSNGGYGSAASSAIVWGGFVGGVSYSTQCELYNGSTWSAGPTLNVGRQPTGSVADSQTNALTWTTGSGLTFSSERLELTSAPVAWALKANNTHTLTSHGGSGDPEDAFGSDTTGANGARYDGVADSWASKTGAGGDPNSQAVTGTSAGDALQVGAYNGAAATQQVKRYDGVGDSWTSKANLLTALGAVGLTGSADDTLQVGGAGNPWATRILTCSRYDGVGNSWTSKASLSGSGRTNVDCAGTAADCLACGGITGGATQTNAVELYDGVGDSWTSKTAMSTNRGYGGSGAPSASAVVWAGVSGGSVYTTGCELYNGVGDSWSAGPTLNVARSGCGSVADSQTNALTWVAGSGTQTTERLEFPCVVVTFSTT